jgi:flagella basal body P-ring formation protein FlgA
MMCRLCLRDMPVISRVVALVLISGILLPVVAWAEDEKAIESTGLEIYIPREVTIKGDAIRLGDVCIIRGESGLAGKAGAIGLGRLSVPGQEIVIDRSLVLGRLAGNGISLSNVVFGGSEKVTIKRQERVIDGERFVEAARSFLVKDPGGSSSIKLDLLRVPKPLIVPGTSKDIKFSFRFLSSRSGSRPKVQVVVLADGKKVGSRDVSFLVRYHCRQMVAKVDIQSGVPLSEENIRVEKILSNYPEAANWSPGFGLISRRYISANSVISPRMIGSSSPELVFKRNAKVVIRIDSPCFLITATGKAISDGRAGEYVKVRNVDSNRIILCKVNSDGSVEPVF